MVSDMEKLEKQLKQAGAEVQIPADYRRKLRQKVLSIAEVKKQMRSKIKINRWVLAAALTIGTVAAAAAGVSFYNYYFIGEGEISGSQVFVRPDEDGVVRNMVIVTPDEGEEVKSPEQNMRELDEIDQLRKQNRRKLVAVSDSWTNGNFSRVFRYEYTLSNGKTETINEGLETEESAPKPATEDDLEEIEKLKADGEGKLVDYWEGELGDKKVSRETYIFKLSDGREVVWSSMPETEVFKYITQEQKLELEMLIITGKAEFLGNHKRDIDGRDVRVDTYRGKLSDGSELTVSMGSEFSAKSIPTIENMKELMKLREEEKGEDVGVEEKEVQGIKFRFTKKRYVLSDGTEHIESNGVPVE